MREAFIIDSFDDTIDPPIADRLLNSIVIGHSRLFAVLLIIYQPYFPLDIVILNQPFSPRVTIRDIQ